MCVIERPILVMVIIIYIIAFWADTDDQKSQVDTVVKMHSVVSRYTEAFDKKKKGQMQVKFSSILFSVICVWYYKDKHS